MTGAEAGRTTTTCGYCRAQDHTTEQHVPFDAPGRTPSSSDRARDSLLRAVLRYGTARFGRLPAAERPLLMRKRRTT